MSNTPAPAGNALVPFEMDDELRRELLTAQAQSISTAQSLTQLKMLAAGACQFELSDEPGKTFPTIRGVILNSHLSNVLWDRKFEDEVPAGDDLAKLPACSSTDGIVGVPREGFAHANLGGRMNTADGELLTVNCATCVYNQWNSGDLLIPDKKKKGKAVTNNKRIFIMLENRITPVELIVSPMSLKPVDDYVTGLLNKGIPVQGVVTEFAQVRQGAGRVQYGVLTLQAVGMLNKEQFAEVIARKNQFKASIEPKPAARPGTYEAMEDKVGAAHRMPVGGKALPDDEFSDFPGALADDETDDLPF